MASIWSRPQCTNYSKQYTSSNAVIIAFCFYTISQLQINYWSLSSDVIWRYVSWSTLVQLFWYLTPTSHSLNQLEPPLQEKYLSLQIMITVICTLTDNHADHGPRFCIFINEIVRKIAVVIVDSWLVFTVKYYCVEIYILPNNNGKYHYDVKCR